jgi:glutamine synthetase
MEAPFSDFGSMVFGEKEMADRLPNPVYQCWKNTVAKTGTLDRPTADAIAFAMKTWALENGATHFTHWFQPMTGSTAEKHDSFVNPGPNGEPLLRFSGKSLIKGEPDASSFPSGGLRATFEARGYTYWDVTSPVFIRDGVLCIPTIFVSYNGESLDKKEPLLKSIEAVSRASTRIVNLFGDSKVTYCTPVVGLEQEYFLVDRKYYDARSDLNLCGRTLFGAPATKGQELGDHYFGSIPTRVSAFMKDVDHELWKLGIYAKAEHNEVAPGQFELAPVYSSANIAVDQNQLTMDILKKTAEKHGLACLLHEKPFAGINGSGKHNNWSIQTSDGQNLFSPGEKPAENIRFLVFICAFLKAVDEHPLLLRMSSSGAGNDHRLGANEAPPAIISIYLGSYIEDVLYGLYKPGKTAAEDADVKKEFSPVSGLSYIPRDNTDRNRTSPVAFTGNKFEFRMLGSSLSAALPNIVLNSIMAESLNEIAEQLEGIKYLQDVRTKALEICKKIIHDHKRIMFSGDGYSEEWVKEAERRGLPNVKSFIESTAVLKDPKTVKLFTTLGVYTEKELLSRGAILAEQYDNTVEIEARTLLMMVRKQVLPAMTHELAFYSQSAAAAGKDCPKFLAESVKRLETEISGTDKAVKDLEKIMKDVLADRDSYDAGVRIYHEICPAMLEVRKYIDEYEAYASSEYYHIPGYQEMLFSL